MKIGSLEVIEETSGVEPHQSPTGSYGPET